MKNNIPTILIIFGVSGDLSKRYLLPALGEIARAKMLPNKFEIIGVTRRLDFTKDDILKNSKNRSLLKKKISFFEMNVKEEDEFKRLSEHILNIEKRLGLKSQRLFYLSVPPEACSPIVEKLGASGLANVKNTKLLLEKPFGTDYKSAKELVEHIKRHFDEEQVYRIDHYLAKESAQNIIVFRNGNSLFKKTWNKDFIEKIDIIASESIGIEGRVHFYEQTGALRDYVQSHLLQLTALVLMDLPQKYDFDKISRLRLEALSKLKIVCDIKNKNCVKRGQYEGYKKEVKNDKSTVETFVSIALQSEDPKWKGVPINISTGKALEKKFTEIRISYRKNEKHESNELVIRLQPNPGIEFNVWVKKPGYEWDVSPHFLHFNFKEHYKNLPEAYEQVLYSAINNENAFFAKSEEVLESWRILNIIQKSWERYPDDLIIYKKGSKPDDICILK